MKIGVGRKNATNVPGVGKVWRVNKRYNQAASKGYTASRAKRIKHVATRPINVIGLLKSRKQVPSGARNMRRALGIE